MIGVARHASGVNKTHRTWADVKTVFDIGISRDRFSIIREFPSVIRIKGEP